MTLFDALIQVVIGIFGTLALFLTIKGYKTGSWIGLATQPFWIFMAIDKQLWGVLMVSLIYAAVWLYGILK